MRLHYGPIAAALAENRQATAYTYGTHIVLGQAAQRVSNRDLQQLLAHELIHVVQQSAPTTPVASQRWTHPPARAPPVRPLLRTSLGPQNLDLIPDFVENAAGAVYHGAVDVTADAIGGAVELAGDVGDLALEVGGLVLEGAEEVVDYFAPGLLDFLRGDVLDDLKDLFCSGVDAVVSLVLDPLADLDIMTILETVFRSLTAGVEATYGALGKTASAAVGVLLRPLIKVIDVWGDDIIAFVQGFSDGINAVFTALWDNIAKPVIDFFGAAGKAVWDAFTGLITWIWDLAKPVRDAAQFAWDWLMKKFGLAWKNTKSIREWLTKKAEAAWKKFLKVIEPIKKPLMVVAGILVMLSPLGPIIILTQVLPPIWDKLKWLAANWKDTEIVVRARAILKEDILPFLIGAVETVKGLVKGAASWLAGVVSSIARGMKAVISVFGSNDCLKAVSRVLVHVADQFDRLQKWAEGGFQGLEPALGAAFDALRAIFQPILDFLVRLLIVAANPPLLPAAIVGAIWLLLPDEFKPSVINFVLGLLIAFLSGFPAFLTGLGPLASVLKAAVLGFLRHLKSGEGVDDDGRIAASNKMANLMAGGGPAFIAGYAIGLVHGLIDGIIDPFKLLFMLFDLIVTGIKVLGRVLAPYVQDHAPQVMAQGITSLNEALAVSGGGTGVVTGTQNAPQAQVTGQMIRGPPAAEAAQPTSPLSDNARSPLSPSATARPRPHPRRRQQAALLQPPDRRPERARSKP